MQWQHLLCEKRIAREDAEPAEFSRYPLSAFEKDYKRIISSSAFRRLQDKTQVFPLDRSDFVRTRLTHSIEVATTARQLSIMINGCLRQFKANSEYEITDQEAGKMSDLLMCTGMLHDLGNPPFGHFGEMVIGDWFKRNLRSSAFRYRGKKITDVLSPQMVSDLENFEGNAQALRILAKCLNNPGGSDMNLTYGVINTLVKYPTDSGSVNRDDPDVKKHKLGYFASEQEIFTKIAHTTGTYSSKGGIVRHPLTYILEAADDIAYVTADLEDAFKKDLFSIENFIVFYDRELMILEEKLGKKASSKSPKLIDILRAALIRENRSAETDLSSFNEWVGEARGWLMHVATYSFTTNYEAIMQGTYPYDLFEGTFHEHSIKALKNAMAKYAYHSPDILKLELSAQTIIGSLMDNFVPAALYYGESDPVNAAFNQTKADEKYTDLISDNYKTDYLNSKTDEDEGYDLYLRFLLVTDYISGMTDSFAKRLYQELNGIC